MLATLTLFQMMKPLGKIKQEEGEDKERQKGEPRRSEISSQEFGKEKKKTDASQMKNTEQSLGRRYREEVCNAGAEAKITEKLLKRSKSQINNKSCPGVQIHVTCHIQRKERSANEDAEKQDNLGEAFFFSEFDLLAYF